ncbi:MAG: copper resistance protein NlpE N-terminal domain-containing protein [Chloroflexi bacterium]|nr:copper resistance protein NlpE N-terminal domain-containing protein [Chloroflexota bacterium]
MRFKILVVSLMAMSLMFACRPGPARMMPRPHREAKPAMPATPPTPVSVTPQTAPEFTGIYKHLSLAADAPAIDSTLYLNTDGSFKLIDEYVGKATNTQVGTWAANTDGSATITTTGQLDRKFDKPIVEQVRFTDDTTTTMTVEGDKSSQWTRFEALVEDYTKETYDPKAATEAIQARGWAGLYKAALPAADCCGLDITLFLNADKSAEFRSDYLNGKAAISEVGTWTASTTQTMTSTAPVTVTVVITGQKEQTTTAKLQTIQLVLQDGILVTTKTSDILPDGRLKLYSADGLIAPERAAFAAQASVETPATPKMPHYPKHLPFWVRFLMLVERVCQHLLDMHFSGHSLPDDFKLPTT